MKTKCANCGKELDRPRYRVMRHKCYCNTSCQMKNEYRTGVRDKNKITKKANEVLRERAKVILDSGNFTTRISKRGYLMYYIPLSGWINAHQYVWVKEKGAIPEGMSIHHINGDRFDNRIENMQLITNSEHGKLHNADRTRDSNGRFLKL